MFTTILLTLAVASAPANDPNNGAAAAAVAASKSAETTVTTPARKPTSYCIVDTVTGSRIPYKTCKTREQWMARGFDPLNVR